MPNLFQKLRNRELTGKAKHLPLQPTNERALPLSLTKMIEHNVHTNNSLNSTIMKSGIVKLERSGNFVAILDENHQLTLFDIFLSKEIWSLQIDCGEHEQCIYPTEELIVSDNGLVIYAKEHPYDNDAEYQIFYAGKMLGVIQNFIHDNLGPLFPGPKISFKLKYIRIINDRIYGISFEEDHFSFYEYDKQGNMLNVSHVRDKPVNLGKRNTFEYILSIAITCSNDYYVLFSPYDNKIYIFNLHLNKKHELDLSAYNKVVIDSFALLDNQLILGYHHKIPELKNSKIDILDIQTGRRINQFEIPEKNVTVKNLCVNAKYIVFCADGNVYSINLASNTLITILPSSLEPISLGLFNSTLVACRSLGGPGMFCVDFNKLVINLETNEISSPMRYESGSYAKPSFMDGILVIPKRDSEPPYGESLGNDAIEGHFDTTSREGYFNTEGYFVSISREAYFNSKWGRFGNGIAIENFCINNNDKDEMVIESYSTTTTSSRLP